MIETSVKNLFLIPSHIDLVGAEIEMLNIDNRETLLKRVLSQVRNEYDYTSSPLDEEEIAKLDEKGLMVNTQRTTNITYGDATKLNGMLQINHL